jgi:parallel beta-helix repeat protein/predicted outer membrane repeat protein
MARPQTPGWHFLVVIVAAAGMAAQLQAGVVLYVDDDTCPDPGDGSQLNPYCSIQAAIDAAVDTDEIVVAPGTYFETIDFIGKALWLHSSEGPEVTVIDAQGSGSVVTCESGEGPGTVLEGFTITGGAGTWAETWTGHWRFVGGGMFVSGGFDGPTVSDCTFTSNAVSGLGGGIYIYGSGATVTNCTFHGNTADDSGGGMCNFFSSPTVTNCTFSGNSAGSGGGMRNVESSSPTVINCNFSDNSAAYGGGGIAGGGNLTVTNCTFIGNAADVYDGGGIWTGSTSRPMVTTCTFADNIAGNRGGGMRVSADAEVIDCTFSGNIAASTGGGMFGSHTSQVTDCSFSGNTAGSWGGGLIGGRTVTNCTFIGNTAGFGGGLITDGTVINCTFASNAATSKGGAMYNYYNSPTVLNCAFNGNTANDKGGAMYNLWNSPMVINCTFNQNSAVSGGAMYNNASNPTVRNCILWGDSPDEIQDESGNPPFASTVSYSDVQGGWPGIRNIDADPVFVDPDNGDFRLSPGSPCIDAGHNNAIAGRADTDLDGNPRFADNPATPDSGCGVPVVVDMGAYEFQGEPAVVVFADLTGDNVVGLDDFDALLSCWSASDEPCCVADLDRDGAVNVVDFLILLASWG